MFNFISNYIFWIKVLNRISHEKNRLYHFLPVNLMIGRNVNIKKDELKQRLSNLLGYFDIHLFESVEDDIRKGIIKTADEILNHDFDLLGSGRVHLDPINWHIDFKSGFIWEKGRFYTSLRKLTHKGADIKVPWELNRCHHLLWLGEGYLLTDNEEYAKEVVDEIEDWINSNPLMRSVNWTCSMDVAIRAVNWLYAVNMIIKSDYVNDAFVQRLYKSLYQHSFFIFNNLEKTIPYSNNHYFSDIVGLLYLSQLFRDKKLGKKCEKFALSEYYSEIRNQVLPSGIHFEKSISYHRLMTELCSYPFYMLKRIGVNVPMDIESRVRAMHRFIFQYLKPNGYAPLIADNDDGRLLPFVRRDFREHTYLLDENSVENLFAKNGVLLSRRGEKENSSLLYEDVGYAILRNNNAFLFICNGGQSRYQDSKKLVGTHTHNDLLSFEFSIGKDDIIVDPGTYLYTSDIQKRNEFRSTKKHNTVVVDHEEQNILSEKNAFLIERNTIIKELCLDDDVHCRGVYKTLRGQMVHEREFALNPDSLVIADHILKPGNTHKICLYFHFSMGADAAISEKGYHINTRDYDVEIMLKTDLSLDLSLYEDTVSPSYGVVKNSKTAKIEFDIPEEARITTTIKWTKKN